MKLRCGSNVQGWWCVTVMSYLGLVIHLYSATSYLARDIKLYDSSTTCKFDSGSFIAGFVALLCQWSKVCLVVYDDELSLLLLLLVRVKKLNVLSLH